jgi:4-amino-4-deoxy-L-arabinose transferase
LSNIVLRMKKIVVYLFILYVFIYIFLLSVRPMLIPDETRYAEIGRELIEKGNWIVPRLDGFRYFEKPILGHWLHALSIKIFGENSFAIRLPSVLAVGLSALMIFFLIRHVTKSITFAAMAFSIFLTCLLIFSIGTFCILDSIFSMFITGSIIASYLALIESRPLRRNIFLVISGLTCGLAFLTKGFLAFIIPAIVIIPFAIWQKQLKKLIRIAWLPFILSIITVLPWSIMIYLREPDFWHYFFWVENVERFLSPIGGQHPYPIWFFVPTIIIGMLPWTFQIIGEIIKFPKDSFHNPLIRFSICWFVFPFIFFSISGGKLITYILPCIPPLIVLFIVGLNREGKISTSEKCDSSNKFGVVLIILIMVVFYISQRYISLTRMYRQEEFWKILVVMAGLLVYGIFLVIAQKTIKQEKKFAFSCIAPLMLIVSSQFIIPDMFIEEKAPIHFLNQYKDKINNNTILISDNMLTPAVCWCYKRSDVLLLDKSGEFTYGIEYDDLSKQRFLDIDKFIKLISQDLGDKHVVLITSMKRYSDYKSRLPSPTFEDTEHGFVFAEFHNNI